MYTWRYVLAVAVLTLLACVIFAGCKQEPVWAQEVNLKIIAIIESGNNPNAFNKSSGAVGKYQICKPALTDYNKAHKRQFQLSEMFDPLKAEIVARDYLNRQIPAYLRHYGIADTLEHRLWCYNAGIGLCKKRIMPQETKQYILRYHRLEGKI